MEATRKAINQWNHNDNFKWELLPISKQTANKLLAGEFDTFEKFFEFSIDNVDRNMSNEVLYRREVNNNREEDIYIIETIFINE